MVMNKQNAGCSHCFGPVIRAVIQFFEVIVLHRQHKFVKRERNSVCYYAVFRFMLARVGVQPSGNLHIADVRLSDEGVYQCIAINPVSLATTLSLQTTTLRVRGMHTLYGHMLILSREFQPVYRQAERRKRGNRGVEGAE